jgi:RHS repeat-associated protein
MNAVTVVNGGGVIANYNYSLGAAGNRTGVSEFTGRLVTWTPDDLYRLTSELIFNDPATVNNGTLGYVYDPVGNRNQRTSSVSIIGTQNFTGGYDPADQLKPAFNFDQNGNELTDGVFTYQYNNLNQLTRVQGTGVDLSYLYDGDGLRVQKINNMTGVTTKYFWDDQNPTGVPQVLEELESGQVVRRYVYGPNGPLYQVALVGSTWVTSYYGRDAQSIRFLMDASGNVTDSLTWDSFGRLLSRTGTTPLFLGYQNEYTEPETGLVYLRARWYNPNLDRFMGMDTYQGDQSDPRTLQKYVGFADDPDDKIDPSGNQYGTRISELLQGLITPLKKGNARQYLAKYPTEIFIPEQVDLDENIERSFTMSFGTWFWNVFPKGAWDYKFQYGFDAVNGKQVQNKNFQKLANLANFNFGTTGKALPIGLSEDVLLRGAGAAEIGKYFLGQFDFNGYLQGQGQGSPLGGAPYGDAPRDQLWIQQGFKYFNLYYAAR